MRNAKRGEFWRIVAPLGVRRSVARFHFRVTFAAIHAVGIRRAPFTCELVARLVQTRAP